MHIFIAINSGQIGGKYITLDHYYRQSGERNVQAAENLHGCVNLAALAALAVLLGLGRGW